MSMINSQTYFANSVQIISQSKWIVSDLSLPINIMWNNDSDLFDISRLFNP